MSDELLYTQEDRDEWARTCEELQDEVKELQEETNELREKDEQLKKTYDYNIVQERKEIRKETAKEIITELKIIPDLGLQLILDGLADKYGVEVEE